MDSSSLVRFEKDSIELYINTQTGESFASKRGYARIANKDESTIRKRIQGAESVKILRVEVQTHGGLQGADLITEGLICEWLPKDNPEMATKLMQLGVRSFLHTLAGYEVKSTAVNTPLSTLDLFELQLKMLREQEANIKIIQQAQIDYAIEQAVVKALAEQTAQQTQANTTQIEQLTAEVQLLKSLLNQPIPTCDQTARQRLVELCQLIGEVLVQKGTFPTFAQAISKVWQRVLLKLKHSSARVDIPNRKTAELKKYQQLVDAWNAAGRPSGQKPLKKNYDLNNAQWIERLHIEQDALKCAIAVGNEIV